MSREIHEANSGARNEKANSLMFGGMGTKAKTTTNVRQPNLSHSKGEIPFSAVFRNPGAVKEATEGGKKKTKTQGFSANQQNEKTRTKKNPGKKRGPELQRGKSTRFLEEETNRAEGMQAEGRLRVEFGERFKHSSKSRGPISKESRRASSDGF